MYKQTKSKKGLGLNDAFGATLTIVLLGVLLIVSLVLFSNLGNTYIDSETSSATQNAFTLTDAGTTLTDCDSAEQGDITSIALINATGGETILESGNYTYSSCVLTAEGASPYNGTSVNASYDYTYAGQPYETSDDMITAFVGYIPLVTLVGTIIFLAIVIGVLVNSFMYNRKNNL